MKRMIWFVLFLCCFSGNAFPEGKWTLYSTRTPDERIIALAIEGDFVWAGTDSGVVKLNRTDGASVRYTKKDGLVNDLVTAIAIDHNGVKWFGHVGTSGISSFNNTVFKTYTKGNTPEIARYDSLHNKKWGFSIYDIVVDPENTVLFAANGGWQPPESGGWLVTSELFIFQNNTWKIKEAPSLFPFYIAVDTVNPDTVWYCTELHAGYFVKPNYNKSINDTRFLQYIPHHSLGGRVIAMDGDNHIWYGRNSDIFVFDRSSFICFPPDSTGIFGYIDAMVIDKNNVKWFGSSMGITRYDGVTWKNYAPDDWQYNRDSSISDIVLALAFDADGVLWAGTNKGLYRFEETPTAVQDAAPKAVSVAITGISPNPFNASSAITFSLQEPGMAALTVYSLTGQKVRTLVSGRVSAGKHTVVWDGRDDSGGKVSSGVFIVLLESGGKKDSRKALLLK